MKNIFERYQPTYSPPSEGAAGAGTESPSSAGAHDATPAAAPSTPSGGEASSPAPDPFGGFDGFETDDTIEIPAAAEGEAAPPAAAPSAPEPPAPPAQAQPTPPAPQPSQGAPQPAPQQPAEGQPPAETAPQDLTKMLGEHRGALIQALAQERFALTKEEAEAFDADAMSAIPQVAARIYYEAVTTTLNHINNLVPRLIENHLRAQKAHDEAENEFYSQFAALDRSKHAGDVRQFAAAFRGANPQIARQDLFAMIGAAVMAKYGLQAPPAKQPNGAQRVSQPLPFVPAPAGARGGAVTVSKDSDPFSGLDMNFDD